jgi:hypothetical protein
MESTGCGELDQARREKNGDTTNGFTEVAFGNTMGQTTNEAARVKENHDARYIPLDKGKEKDTRMRSFEATLSNGRDNDPNTSGENGADELDHSASTSVYTGHLIIPRMWKRIAPEEKALARMREECGHDPELVNEVLKSMKRYYGGIDTPKASFATNLRVRELRRQLERNYRAKRKGRPMPFPMPPAEFLAQRYCHPMGMVDQAVASCLAQLGKSHLSCVNWAQENGVAGSTRRNRPEHAVKANRKTGSASRVAALEANQKALEANQKELKEHRSHVAALEAEQKLLEANRKVLEASPSVVADNAAHATQREIPQNVATNNIPGVTHQLEAVQEVATDNTARVMEPESAATKASDVIVTKSFLARVLERVIDGELADERAKLANEIKSTVEKELAELRARIVQLEAAHHANPSGPASRPLPGQLAHTPQDLSISEAKTTMSAPAYPEVTNSIQMPHASLLDRGCRRRRGLMRQGGDAEDGRPAKRLARRDCHTGNNDEPTEPLVELDTRMTAAGSAIKKEDRFE